MPRYFFHLLDGREVLDHEGTELSGVAEARVQAVVASGEVLRDSGAKFWDGQEWRMWVTDEVGATVCALRFTAE
jgi:hypothetical protein